MPDIITMNSTTKDFTVVIPAFNASNFIEPCLASIKNATGNFSVEIIVIDDSSTDDTVTKALQYTDKVISIPKSQNRLQVRVAGFKLASGNIIVNVDSDIIIPDNTFIILNSYFNEDPTVHGVSGVLSTDSGDPGFFSIYKHLYMNYIYNKTPKNVSFLYGSLFAIHNNSEIISHLENLSINMVSKITDDTEAGLSLSQSGFKLNLVHHIHLKHLKHFSLLGLLKNDFDVPKDFGKLWWRYGNSRSVLEEGGNFTHTSYRQVASLLLAAIISILAIYCPTLALISLALWTLLNANFIRFLSINQGSSWALASYPIIFVDNIVMFLGTIVGLTAGYCEKK